MRARLRSALLGPAVPAALAALAAAGFAAAGVAAYLGYHSGAYDLGFFDQVVEQTARGHPYSTSFLAYSFLGQHWEPVLALWSPLDRVAATPLWLVAIDALALAAAPLFGWRLARTWLGEGWAAPVAALACVIDPLIVRTGAFSYHSEALTPALALAALDGAARGHRWRFLLPALALGAVKEDALLVAAGVAWIAWCVHRRHDALVLLGASVAAFAAVVGVVMPGFRGGFPTDLAANYAYLGGTTPAAMLRGAVTHPGRVLDQLTGTAALRGWAVALLPLAVLPCLAGWAALATLPALLVGLLAASSWESALLFHYGIEAFPLLLACALLGWRRLRDRRVAGDAMLAPVVVASLVAGYLLASPLPGGIHARLDAFSGLDRRSAVEAVLRLVPADAPVSASSGLVPHLSARAQVYEFPDRAFEEPWVVLDERGPRPTWTQARWAVDAAALPAHGYRLVASDGGVSLWARYPGSPWTPAGT